MTVKFSMQPSGKVDLIMAASGMLPNYSASTVDGYPRLPYVGKFIGDFYLEADGPFCPGAWQRVPMKGPCAPGDPSCLFVTNYPFP